MRQFDPHTPNLARMYDYMLGGKDNFAVDRLAIEQLAELVPEAVPLARANRAFLQRAVRYVSAAGVTQFLDLGSGLPTQGSVHEVAPEARVVYVDNDPVVAAHARALLAGSGRAAFLEADLLDHGEVLAHAGRFLDLSRPVAIVLVSILHFLPDAAGPQDAVAALREAVAPGSHLVISHATSMARLSDEEETRGVYRGSSRSGGADRSPAEIRGFFGGFVLDPPGLVQAVDWRPDRPKLVGDWSLPSSLMAGVAKKPD
ncbi:SAM-dependent methyltransferase [Nonomuraea spiralis]|uniref:SAM-dependent methyltransferase n=1 Tax=Nonomuraea TaxID=83681 RepID=UPI0021AD64E0|nr:SAM-dependent methyltransferase [Nonomuraea sp. WAC 01424]